MRTRVIAAFAAFLALGVFVSSAGAVVTKTSTGRIGYLPLNGVAAEHAAAPKATEPSGEPPLVWHGGPVMHSQTAYAIFWAPSGYSFPAGYENGVVSFLENVAADSGKPSNVYSVSAQYTDSTGHAAYIDSFGGKMTDTTAYPTSGTCPTYSGFGESFTACITDAKLEAEVNADVTAKSWPKGLADEYYVVLPPEVGSCFQEGSEFFCFDEEFCAYHNYSESGNTIYANISYSPGDPIGCGVGEYPNGHANGNVDDTLSSLSHEANESITDPTLEAYFDEIGFEDGDECRNTPLEEDYGPPLGGAAGALFNQSINGGHYYLQQEWSNDVNDCVQRVKPATPVIADPEEVVPGESVPFDGSGSVPGSGGIVPGSYSWDFGDTHTGSGVTTSHTFALAGEYTVTLTVKDDGGFSYSTSRKVTVTSTPHRTLTVSLAGSGSGTVAGSGISCPGTCSHSYPKGESVTLTATPASGSTFSGWSGGGCSGTGTCSVTMNAKQAVTASFAATSTGGGSGPTPAPTPAPVPPPPPATKVQCHKGFKKAKKHGKTVCVKVKKKHRHKHHH